MNHKKLIEISEEIVIHQKELAAIKKYAKILINQRHLLLNVRLQMELVNTGIKKPDLFCDEVNDKFIVMPIFGLGDSQSRMNAIKHNENVLKQDEAVMFSVNYMPPDMALVMFEHMAKFHQYKIDLLQKEYAQTISKSLPQIQKLLNQ